MSGNTHMKFYLSASSDLFNDRHQRFNTWEWLWEDAPERTQDRTSEMTATQALRHVAHDGQTRRVPVGVIGPRDATDRQHTVAEDLGRTLAELGLTVVCGGHGGVMAAVSKGARGAGGLTVGILPGTDWHEANPDIVLPIATGLSEGRNMVIARSCAALIAVGGSYGTLSEVAYGKHFSKPVFGLEGAPQVDGVVHLSSVDDLLEPLAMALLNGELAD